MQGVYEGEPGKSLRRTMPYRVMSPFKERGVYHIAWVRHSRKEALPVRIGLYCVAGGLRRGSSEESSKDYAISRDIAIQGKGCISYRVGSPFKERGISRLY